MDWVRAYDNVALNNPRDAYNEWAQSNCGEVEACVLTVPETWFMKDYSGKLLDVGCGNGRFAARLFQYGEVDFVIALDVSDVCVSHAQKAFEKYKVNGEVVRGSIEEYLSTEVFDTITCWEVLEHLRRPDLALNTIRRMLDENGVVIGSVPEGLAENNWLHLHHFYNTDLLELLSGQFNDIRIIQYEKRLLFVARQPKVRHA